MKKNPVTKILVVCLVVLASISALPAQKKRPPVRAKPIIFAVINDGRTIEPLAFID